MTHAILDGTNLDTSVFAYSAPKAHASGGKVVNLINKHSKESLSISTPLLMTWGAQESKDQSLGRLRSYANPLNRLRARVKLSRSNMNHADALLE